MSEYFEHNRGDHEDPLPGPTWLVAFIGAVLLAVVCLGVTALLYRAAEEEETEKLAAEPAMLEAVRQSQRARITAPPHWEVTEIDNRIDERRLVIPIEDAMQKIVEESGS